MPGNTVVESAAELRLYGPIFERMGRHAVMLVEKGELEPEVAGHALTVTGRLYSHSEEAIGDDWQLDDEELAIHQANVLTGKIDPLPANRAFLPPASHLE